MLKPLIDYGYENKYFLDREIKDINKSCCTTTRVKVIDFDKTKDELMAEMRIPPLSSCDAIKFINTYQIDFIEMKSIKQILLRTSDKETIQNQIDRFNVKRKIRDSLHILYTIWSRKGLNSEESDNFFECEKNFFLVTDIDIKQNALSIILTSMLFLSLPESSLESFTISCIEESLEGIKNTNLNCHINKFHLMTCKMLEDYYS